MLNQPKETKNQDVEQVTSNDAGLNDAGLFDSFNDSDEGTVSNTKPAYFVKK